MLSKLSQLIGLSSETIPYALQRIKEKVDEATHALRGLIADYEHMVGECAKLGNEAKDAIEMQVREQASAIEDSLVLILGDLNRTVDYHQAPFEFKKIEFQPS